MRPLLIGNSRSATAADQMYLLQKGLTLQLFIVISKLGILLETRYETNGVM